MTLHSIVIQKLLSTNAHLGRRAAAEHFKIYTYGVRNRQTIIDSDKTLICLRNAVSFISHLARDKNARFLFVNTNPLFDEIVEHMTKKIGLYSPRDNIMWRMGGFLTNSFSPKKFRSRNKKVCFGPIQPPDCVVVIDTERKSSVILEADKLQVPIVALVDSSMPLEYYKKITYPVPANDSAQFVYLFCNLITKTFLLEQKNWSVSKKEKRREELLQIEQSKDDLHLIPYEDLPCAPDISEIKNQLDKLVVVKFNTDFGTAIGFDGPKSAIDVHNGLSSLDLIVNHIMFLNSKYGCHIPLVLINTTETHDDIMEVLGKYSKSNIEILPLSLESLGELQSKDKMNSDEDSLIHALMEGGTLDLLLSRGKEYVLHISSDDAASNVDPKILNHMIINNTDICMELTENTQKPSMDAVESQVQDTRNFWVNLNTLRRLVEDRKMEKFSEEQQRENTTTVQLFDKKVGIVVPESRFVPLKTTSDLLLLQSDLYSCAEGVLVRNPDREDPSNPSIDLGSEFKKVGDFLSRFKTIPSLVELNSLKVRGDVWFGADVTLQGDVRIIAKPGTKLEIPDGTKLEDVEINDQEDLEDLEEFSE